MQTNGIGNSHSDMHHVTNCIHNHKHRLDDKVGGGGGAGATETQPVTAKAQQSQEPFSLSAWLRDTFSGAKKLFGKIWGSDADAVQGETNAKIGTGNMADAAVRNATEVVNNALDVQSGLQQNLQQEPYQQATNTRILHNSQIEAASVLVQPAHVLNNNPYFTTTQESEKLQQTVWQKIKIRFQNITGFLAKRFSFTGGGPFQTKQERPKEDLRKHSRYRKDDVEIDCVLTDESYLLDSYNKKGEYSKLSAGK